MRTAYICDGCNEPVESVPWDCPGCGKEVCENCFSLFAHCLECSCGKSDEELRLQANEQGFEFSVDSEGET